MKKPHVFITDGRSRATLVMSKFLREQGINVAVGEERWQCHSFFSKYVNKRIIYPSIEKHPDKFIEFLRDYLKNNRCDAIFPVRDDATRIISFHKNELSRYTEVPVPDYEILQRANNKIELAKVAIENNFPCPSTFFTLDRKKIKFPLLLRPMFGSGSRGIIFVKDENDLSQFEETHKDVQNIVQNYLIQEYIPHHCTDQYLVSCLFDMESEPMACFALRKMREYPYSGGPMTCAVSVKNEGLIDQTITLLKALKWQGMCAVEYIYDRRDNKYKVTEINARYYGALGTALYSGVNFPYHMYRMAVGKKFEVQREYKYGVKWRWLYPGDLLAFWDHPNKLAILSDFLKFWDCQYAILSLTDPGPSIGNTIDMLYRFLNKMQRDRVFKRGWK